MLQIFTLYLQVLKEKLFIAFIRVAIETIDQFEVIEQMFPYYVGQLKAAYDEMNLVYLKYDVDYCTKQLREDDDARIKAYLKMRNAIRAVILQEPEEPKMRAAEILLDITNRYGGSGVVNMTMAARSTSIVNLLEDFEDKYPAEVETLGIGNLVEALKAAQAAYDKSYLMRNECDSEVAKGAMAEARRHATKAYREFETAVNLEAGHDEEGKLSAFIRMLNVEVKKNRTHTGQGQPESTPSSENTGAEGDTVYKFAAFKYIGGNEIKLKVEVGTPLIAPDNTEGYSWEPEVPELMPKTNKTFHEVAIDPEEGEAIFHFLDHHEEVLRQHVGTELVAPLNTENCIWVPTPPELMPAGQTNYAEELAQQILNPAENITIKFRGIDNQILHEMVVPVDYQMTEEEYPTPPEGTHWNFTLADLNLAIGMKNPGDTITVRAQA